MDFNENALRDAEAETVQAEFDQRTHPLDAEEARALWNWSAGLRLRDPSRFLLIAQALTRAVEADHSLLATAIAACCHAEALNAAGRLKDAAVAYESAQGLAERTDDSSLLGQVLLGRVHVVSQVESPDAAERLAKQAEDVLRESGNRTLLAKLFMNRGNAFYQSDRYQQALELYAQSDALFAEAAPEDPARVGLKINRASAALSAEDLAVAEEQFIEAASLAERLGLDYLGAYARYNQAVLERVRGNHRDALRLLEATGEVFARQGTADMKAAVDLERAEIHFALGMPEDAAQHAATAAQEFTVAGMELDAAIARLEEGRSHLALGEPERAEPLLVEAERYFTRAGNRPRQALAQLARAEQDFLAGRLPSSLRRVRTTVRTFAELGLRRWETRARVLGARVLLGDDRPAGAARLVAPMLSEATNLPMAERRAVWTQTGRAALLGGDAGRARRYLERAAETLEVERLLVPGPELRSRGFDSGLGIYRDLIELELREPSFERLFTLVESARGRGYRDRSGGMMGHGFDAAAAVERERLGSLTRRLEESEMDPDRDAEHTETLRRRVLALEQELLRKRRTWLGPQDGPESGTEIDPDRITRDLAPDAALVTFFLQESRTLALVLRHEARHLVVLPAGREEIQAALHQVRFQIDSALLAATRPGINMDFLRGTADQVLQRLYRDLLEPLEPHLEGVRQLQLVPHGLLHQVPFECLHTGTGYVDERWILSRMPVAHPGRARTDTSPAPSLVAGTVTGGPDYVREEVRAVTGLLAERGAVALEDPATQDLLDRLETAGTVHLCAHGIFREDNPAFSRITTGDGALFLADLEGRRVRADLVVLSACQTGRVFTGRGEDVGGVSLAFLASGAGALVSSLWRVHSEATWALMEAFYRAYAAGGYEDVPAALAEAGRAVRGRWNHPFFWGGFYVYGG